MLILPIFLYSRHIRPLLYPKGSDLALVMASVLSLGFGIYTYFYLPVIDFLPYKVGNHIPSLMVMPPGAEPDVFKVIYTLKNKKTVNLRKMDHKEYLASNIWEDQDWEYVSAPDHSLVKKGYTTPIHALVIINGVGDAFNDEFL